MEKKYQFKTDLLNIHKKDRRNFSLKADANEFELKNGFSIVVPEDASEVIMTAVRDFSDYLFTSMKVSNMIALDAESNFVKISLNEDIEDASGYMGYRISVKDNYITLEGYDERGVAQGLYYLEDLMNLRKAPFLKKEIIKRKALFSPRSTQSPFGMSEWPEAALSLMAHYGLDMLTLWLKDAYTTTRGDFIDIRLISERAARYGIDIAVALQVPHNKNPEDPGAQEYYDKLYGDLFKACPKLKYINLVGETTQFVSRDPHVGKAPFEKNFNENIPSGKPTPGWWPCCDYPEWVQMIKNSVDKYSENNAIIIFSTYNWGYAPEEDRIKLLENLPGGIGVQATWDMFHQYRVGDVVEDIVDYSLCFVGPGEYFESEAKAISKRGDIFLVANSNTTGRTWDFGVAPYEPMPGQWIKRYEKMIKAHDEWGLSGLQENIHYGFYPSFIMDIEKHAFFTNSRPLDEVYKDILKRDYDENADMVKNACDCFDEAITHYIATNEDQYGAYRIGPSFPFWFESTRFGFIPEEGKKPDDVKCHFGNTIYHPTYHPDITGRNTPTGIRIHEEIKQNKIFADLMLKGIGILESAKNPNANLLKLINLSKFIYRCAITVINIKKFYILQQEFALADTHEKAAEILDKAEALILEEKENVVNTIPLAEFDSRIGWEPSMEYTTGVDGLNWKLRQLDHELNNVFPRYRQSNDLIKKF